ncbi:recombinase family protein [Salinispora tropica]|uniref:recombinase family protein n=1 Tax=Salinispora tropica TaxID=168695 RepID=UPI0004B64B3B|nr:recombinase family protein [Salinispora tropica]
MSTCAAPAGSPCRTGKGKVAIQYHFGYARASTARQSLDAQLDSLTEAQVTRTFSEKISTRTTRRPHWRPPSNSPGEIRSSPGERKGSHDPSGSMFTVLAAISGMEREYIRRGDWGVGRRCAPGTNLGVRGRIAPLPTAPDASTGRPLGRSGR